jgi:hypothetical protein
MNAVSLNNEILAVLAITSITVLFYFYNYLTEFNILSELSRKFIQTPHSYQSVQFLTEKSSGILLLGIIPFILFTGVLDVKPSRIGLTIGQTTQFWYLTGSTPLGILFCLLTYYTGSFYLAFLTHASMTITNELFSIYNNPEFCFITMGNQKVK